MKHHNTTENVIAAIRTAYTALSPIQKSVADFAMQNPHIVVMLSISDFADRCGTSETTIMRFLRKIGFDSYQVFRVKLAQELAPDAVQDVYEEILHNDTGGKIARKVVLATTNAIGDIVGNVEEEQIDDAVTLLHQSDRVIFVGIGSSGLVAADAFYKFVKLGLNAAVYQDAHSLSIVAAHTGPRDVIVAISHTGESPEVVNCLELAKENQSRVILITSFHNSTAAEFADVVFQSSTNEVKYLPDATISRHIQLVLVDIIYVALFLRMEPESNQRVNRSRLAIARNKL